MMPSGTRERRKKGFGSVLKRYFIPIAVACSAVIFFLSYNTYLVDHSLSDLKFALDQTARAQTLGDAGKVGVLLDDMLITEMATPGTNPNALNVASLEFAKNIVNKGAIKEQVRDAEFLLGKIVRKKEKARGSWLLAFDRMNDDLQRAIRFITKELPRGAARPELFKAGREEDTSLLAAAGGYEANWQLKDALRTYEEFIEKYPEYRDVRGVRLKIAGLSMKAGDLRQARSVYERLIRESPESDEAKIAERALEKIEQRSRKRPEKEKLETLVSTFVGKEPMQSRARELGMADAYLDTLDDDTKNMVMQVMRGEGDIRSSLIPRAGIEILNKAKAYDDGWMLQEAQEWYEKFISAYPLYEKIVLVKVRLGGAYLRARQYQKALSYYRSILAEYPHADESALIQKLIDKTKEIISVSQKRVTLIEEIKQIQSAPELAQAYYDLGVVDVYCFDLDGARSAFEKVIGFLPGTELAKRAAFNLGWVYKYQLKCDKAVDVFLKIVEGYPQDPIAAACRYQIADSYYKANKFEAAAKNYEAFAEQYHELDAAPVVMLQAGYTYLYDLHDPLRASEVFKKLSTLFSETDVANYVSVNLTPVTERSYRDYGFILLRDGRIEEAKEAFKKALVINNQDAWAYSGLGSANILLVMMEEGVASAVEGVKKTTDEYTYAALAFSYDESGEYLKAIEQYKLSTVRNPRYFVSHYNLGRDYAIIGWYDYAIQEFKEAVKILPDFAQAHNNLGCAYWNRGNIVDAEFEFKTAIARKRDLVEARYNLGVLYEASGKYSKAVDCFTQVLKVLPDSEMTKKHLERVQEKMKE